MSSDTGGPQVVRTHSGGAKWRFAVSARRCACSLLAAAALALSLGGCAGVGEPNGWETTSTVQDPGDAKYEPSDEPYKMGVEQFNRGHYGLAERYFREAVESAPRNAAAWVGLAASYDRVRRFDLADRAYRQAISLSGETTQILNNHGYSYMLRGDLAAARAQFAKSIERDPHNPVILNNLRLLDGSRSYMQRSN